MAVQSKGSEFEREICKRLSEWWSVGTGEESRTDIFWRSSQSGGRATQRAKFGKATFGSYGDIAAVDPCGAPLIKTFTIELKRGRSYGFPGELLELNKDNSKHPWVKCLAQAVRSHSQAKSHFWMLICRRDGRRAVVYVPLLFVKSLPMEDRMKVANVAPAVIFRLYFAPPLVRTSFLGIPLVDFLARVTPKQIMQLNEKLLR